MQHVYQDAVESTCLCLVPCVGSQLRLLIMMLENVPYEMYHRACTVWLGLLELMGLWHVSLAHFCTQDQNYVAVSPLLLSLLAF